MRLWRIQDQRYASSALRGSGAARYPGRWNVEGSSVVYCASSASNAFLETSVRLVNPIQESRKQLVLIPIDIPDEVSRETIRLASLPDDWASAPEATRKIGEEWFSNGRTCLLRVPSVLLPGQANYLINAFHPDFELVLVHPARAFKAFDEFVAGEQDFNKVSPERPVEPIGPRDLFMCHSSNDTDEIVKPLRKALVDKGVSCWVASAEITVGDSIVEKVNEGLSKSKYVLLVISPSFVIDNEATRQKLAALYRETREGRKVVLPIVVNYPGQAVDIAAALPLAQDKQVYVWKGDAFDAAEEIVRSIQDR